MFLKNKNIIFKIRRSKVTDYAALKPCLLLKSSDISWRCTNKSCKARLRTDSAIGTIIPINLSHSHNINERKVEDSSLEH